MFGFSVYDGMWRVGADGMIPFPAPTEKLEGGHAIYMVGYDDTLAAFRIVNSWGEAWGDHGFGWLPYDYVLRGLADDFWVPLSQEWLDEAKFA
jgi:C1A family cysteine protease